MTLTPERLAEIRAAASQFVMQTNTPDTLRREYTDLAPELAEAGLLREKAVGGLSYA